MRTVGTSSSPSFAARTTAAASGSAQMFTASNGTLPRRSRALSFRQYGQPGRQYSVGIGVTSVDSALVEEGIGGFRRAGIGTERRGRPVTGTGVERDGLGLQRS